MVKVQVGGVEKDASAVDQQWLCKLINGLRRDGQSDCVRVRIQDDGVDLALTTPGCAGLGGTRALTQRESKIVDLWRKAHLDMRDFSCGNVHAFLVQLQRVL